MLWRNKYQFCVKKQEQYSEEELKVAASVKKVENSPNPKQNSPLEIKQNDH